MPTPYETTLDLSALHPRLATYFTVGGSGRGEGVFDTVGSPRRWLWPVLWVLGRQGVVFPYWGGPVPFTVTNTPMDAALAATRTFHFPTGDRSMVDLMSAAGGRLHDELGVARRYRAQLSGRVVDGALVLASTCLSLRLGRVYLPLPARVEVTERWDDTRGQQHVSAVITAPLVGRVYEYAGHFTYRVES